MAQVTLSLARRPAAGLWEALTLTRRSRPRPPQLTGRRGYGDGDIESPNDTSNVVSQSVAMQSRSPRQARNRNHRSPRRLCRYLDVFVDVFMLIDNTVSFGPISRTLVTGSTRATPLDMDERCTLKPPAAAVDPARRRSGCAPVFVILM
jgi:hypothetical protein